MNVDKLIGDKLGDKKDIIVNSAIQRELVAIFFIETPEERLAEQKNISDNDKINTFHKNEIEIDTSLPNIPNNIVIVNPEEKIRLFQNLIGRDIRNMKINTGNEIEEYFNVYIEGIEGFGEYSEDYCEDWDVNEVNDGGEYNLETEYYEDVEEDDDEDLKIYIVPTYRLAEGGQIDDDPENMYYEAFIDDIKEIIIDNTRYTFLG